MADIQATRQTLLTRFNELEIKSDVLKAPELKGLYKLIPTLPSDERASFGQDINSLKQELEQLVEQYEAEQTKKSLPAIDVTAPFDVNQPLPALLPSDQGSRHPLMQEIERLARIFERMGFTVEESRELDDQYHMFESLNFPAGHPARDEYDTFMTRERDANNEPFVAPAHTSNMQNRLLKKYRTNLEYDQPIAVVVPDRVFRNEDVDARHEHTFYQIEGVYVSRQVTVGNLIATLQEFLEAYYGSKLEVRVNPFYFPFTEPSFEFALSCPFCGGKGGDCRVCSGEGWVELLGCGLIHPNVLSQAGIDPEVYTGFAFGCGIDRLVMMKHNIEDVRLFHSGRLDFLRQFAG